MEWQTTIYNYAHLIFTDRVIVIVIMAYMDPEDRQVCYYKQISLEAEWTHLLYIAK